MSMRSKKKIGRIAKGEEVIVDMVEEPIQDLFDKMQDLKDDFNRAVELYHEEKTEANAKVIHYADFAFDESKFKLWTAVHERYGHWEWNIGIRDGYALVRIGKRGTSGDMPDFLKKMLKDLKGQEEEE